MLMKSNESPASFLVLIRKKKPERLVARSMINIFTNTGLKINEETNSHPVIITADWCLIGKIDIGDVSDLPGFRIRCQIEFVTIEHGHIVEDDGSIATTALYNAFLSSTCTDFTIKVLLHTVDSQEIDVHKCVLATYSELFRSLFQSDTSKENKSNYIELDGYDLTSVVAMIKYLYTGQLAGTQLNLEEVYRLACELAIKPLQRKCVTLFRTEIDNLARLRMALKPPDKQFPEELLMACANYISKNSHRSFETQEWKELKANNPDVAFALAEMSLHLNRVQR
ncbi:unnamed protein product [Enterobius vermicularis]|uniref:BTB domain-containing protein n=1 Tax=Enterobius vermicularis TaxID=51028 RepID=A0A0N4VAL5_ENTVE|nr:unnamed protein product [Enterobius vermicularis]